MLNTALMSSRCCSDSISVKTMLSTLLIVYISFLKTWRHAFWHVQTPFPTSCYSWHNWSHPGGQNVSCLEFVLSRLYFVVPDRQRDKLNRLLLSRGTGDNESLKKVFSKSFFFRIFPSITEFVALGWWMMAIYIWPIVQAGDIMETLSGKAGNCRSCPANQRVRAMTMAGYLEHLNIPAIIITKIYLNLVPRSQVHQEGFNWPRSSPWTYTHWVSAPSSCLTKEPQGKVMVMTDQLYMPQFLEGINQEKKSKFFGHKLYSRATTLKLIFQKVEF